MDNKGEVIIFLGEVLSLIRARFFQVPSPFHPLDTGGCEPDIPDVLNHNYKK